MTTKEMHVLVIYGDTRPAKDVLKKAGWRWNPEAQHWYMRLVPAHAERVRGGDVQFMAGLKLHRKGCQVTLDGAVVWTSKTFGAAGTAPAPGDHDAPAPGDQDNCDAYGDPVFSRRIPGSAPEDRV